MMESSKGSTNIRNGSHVIGTALTLIEIKSMRFLIMDAPRSTNLHLYLKEMTKFHVTDVVRVCEPTYPTRDLCTAGITVHELEYMDGSSPSPQLIQSWLRLVETTFYMTPPMPAPVGGVAATTAADGGGAVVPPCIAVHCIAGLGRAPVMVAIALIEFANMDSIEAVQFIRSRRRGAINNTQLNYLSSYKKQYKKQKKSHKNNATGGSAGDCGCIIM